MKQRATSLYRKFSWRQRVLPGLIVIGAQKSGTTSLHNYLSQHPQLVPAYQKEVHFFDGGLDTATDTWSKGLSWYHSHFPRRQELSIDQRTYESSPLYLFNPLVAARIAATLPEVKLVAILRDPVERALSQFFYETRIGHETLAIREAFAAEEKRLAPARESGNFKLAEFIHNSYLSRGIYHEQLQRYYDLFPREQLMVIDSGAFFRAPEDGLRRLFAFAGVDENFPVENLRAVNVGGNRKEVDEDFREYLKDYYADHNQKLCDLLGERFEWSSPTE